MKSKTIKCKSINALFAFMLVILLLGGGIGSHTTFAYDSDPETLTPQITETSIEIQNSLATVPTIENTVTNEPLSSTAVTEQNTEKAPSETPEPIETVEILPQLEGDYIPDEIVVRFKPTISTVLIDDCFDEREYSALATQIDILNVYVVKMPAGMLSHALAKVINCAGVLYAEPNYIAYAAETIPNDPDWGNQYGLPAIRAPQGWDLSTGSAAVTIAIIDTGVDFSHPDLAAKLVGGYDFVNNDVVAQDDNGHGTHVAGIAAAFGNDGIGVAGVSWGARIMPVKVLNASASGSFANVAAGIIWATEHGAQVINLSLGGNSPSLLLQDAVEYAYSKGVILVGAAGNSGSSNILYPARYPQVIAVGAVDSTNNRASLSNYGLELDVVAPGVFIYSTIPGGYGYSSGTSMAAPYVSGLAAILCGYPAGSSPDVIAWEIESTARDLGAVGRDDLYGYGLIQMDHAITLILPPSSTPIAVAINPDKVQRPSATSPAASFGRFISLTPTQTQTITPTASQTLQTATLASVDITEITITASPTWTGTPSGAQASLPEQEKVKKNSYIWPCLGLGFILLGLVLAQVAIRWPPGNSSDKYK